MYTGNFVKGQSINHKDINNIRHCCCLAAFTLKHVDSVTELLWKNVTMLARNPVLPFYRGKLMAHCLTLKQL